MNSLLPYGNTEERALATASWASEGDVTSFQDGQVWLGRLAGDRPIGTADDRHVLLVSGTRGGKGVSSIIPNILLWPGSIVVVDPKGENATVAASRRGKGSDLAKGMGQEVYVLDPFDVARLKDPGLRASFNPLDFLDPDHEETPDDAARIADALVVVSEKDPYWDQQARALIKNLILHVISDEDFAGRRSLVTVRELIMQGDTYMTEMAGDEDADPFAMLFEGMRRNKAYHGMISGAGRTYAGMANEAGKTMKQILSSADTHTTFIDSLPMRRVLSSTSSGFSVARLKTDPHGISLFLTLPQRYMETHAGWMRMMVSLIITEMERVPGKPRAGHSVLMLLDEFAGLKRMPIIETASAQIAGFGVKLYLVVQSLVQLKTVYKDNWEVFLGNAGTKIFYSIDDGFTRNYLSQYLGEHEVARTTASASRTDGRSTSRASGQTESTGETWSDTEGTSWGNSTSTSQNYTSGNSWGSSDSESSGWGGSQNSGVTSDVGLFWNTAKSVNSGGGSSWNSGSSSSRNKGGSSSQSTGFSSSVNQGGSQSKTSGGSSTHGTSETFTESNSEGTTAGTSQGLHKRALLTADEIGHLFARLDDDKNPAYPGLALVLNSGRRPSIVRRPKYYEDWTFAGKFDPHPDYEFQPLKLPPIEPETKPERPPITEEVPTSAPAPARSLWNKLESWQRHVLIDAAILLLAAVLLAIVDSGVSPDKTRPSSLAPGVGVLGFVMVLLWPFPKIPLWTRLFGQSPLASIFLKMWHWLAYVVVCLLIFTWLSGR